MSDSKVESWQSWRGTESWWSDAKSEGLAEALEERLDEGSRSWRGLRSRTDVLHNLHRRAVTSFVLRVFISRTAKFLSNSDMQLGNPQGGKKIEL